MDADAIETGSVSTRKSKAAGARTQAFPAREVAGKELEATIGELYLFSNLLSLTRGPAGVSATSFTGIQAGLAGNVVFETAVAVRDPVSDLGAVKQACVARKRAALGDVSAQLFEYADQLAERVSAQRNETTALNMLASRGWQLLGEDAANDIADMYSTELATISSQAAPVLRGAEVGIIEPKAAGSEASNAATSGRKRRFLPRVPHVLCLPAEWRRVQEGGAGHTQVTGRAGAGAGSSQEMKDDTKHPIISPCLDLVRPRMLAPVIPTGTGRGFRLAYPIGHTDARLAVCAWVGAQGHAASAASEYEIVQLQVERPESADDSMMDGTGTGTGTGTGRGTEEGGAGSGPAAMLSVCTSVAHAVASELVWDALTLEALRWKHALAQPSAGHVLHLHLGQAVGQGQGKGSVSGPTAGHKRKRTDKSAEDASAAALHTADILAIEVGATEIVLQGHAGLSSAGEGEVAQENGAGEGGEGSRSFVLRLRMQHLQETQAGSAPSVSQQGGAGGGGNHSIAACLRTMASRGLQGPCGILTATGREEGAGTATKGPLSAALAALLYAV